MTQKDMSHNRVLILITNDDGIEARGLHALASFVRPLGDVVVVAPDGARSGRSAAITAGVPLRVKQLVDEPAYKEYKTTGTPVDCVKLAMECLLDRRPQLVISGINHGANSGVSVVYSGTMGAVFEGVIHGIPSIGFSLCNHDPEACFEVCRNVVVSLCRRVLEQGLPHNTGLNVNIPAVERLQGLEVCRAAHGMWVEEYQRRIDPAGIPYYWLTGTFRNDEPECSDTDEYLLARGVATIVPVTPDRTLTPVIDLLKSTLDCSQY